MNSPKAIIPVAIVGLGRAGWAIHGTQLRARRDFKIVAVADLDAARRAEAEKVLGCPAYATLKALLKTTSAQLVVLATPSSCHEAETLQVFRSNRHCIVEKPMALTHDGAQRMIAAAQKARRRLFVHQNLRFEREFAFLRRTIARGVLGRIFEVRATLTSYHRRYDWQTLRRHGGGLLNNLGAHILDLTLQLLDGPVVSLMSDLRHLKDAGDCEDHAHLFMKTRSGQVADVTLSTAIALPAGPRWMLLGTCGTLICDGKTAKLCFFDPRRMPALKALDGPAPGRAYNGAAAPLWKEETHDLAAVAPPEGFYDNVVAVLRRGAKMAVPPESVARTIRVIEEARKKTKFPPLSSQRRKTAHPSKR
ncbi:MAG: Gfo/Idh/MocA family oxidoreductase [Verrucomicrobiae bacterium]|nr:Gfo/Idh/MocA family oxidoreductase [Verrucomicrobiae bacterium]